MLSFYAPFYNRLQNSPLAVLLETLPSQVAAALATDRHGRLPEWLENLENLPAIVPTEIELQTAVRLGQTAELPVAAQQALAKTLKKFKPWRKGPFSLFGIDIDTEWRSDWKWDRLQAAIQPLDGRLVLDVGCGNGYHCWRMLGAGADLVIGLDPFLLYVMQFLVINHFINSDKAAVLPLGIEDLPPSLQLFDTVFSMGVLYHRRSPMDHLITLRDALRPQGELVLETIIIDGQPGEVLVPEGRYAQMRNVWFLPSPETLIGWLRKCGFQQVQLIDVTPTTTAEQRATPWMTFQSLSDYLDPEDKNKTIEGYPAPIRAIITAVAP